MGEPRRPGHPGEPGGRGAARCPGARLSGRAPGLGGPIADVGEHRGLLALHPAHPARREAAEPIPVGYNCLPTGLLES
jgi:hypothetical protein